MQGIARAFAEGGIWMYFILLSGLLGLAISALQFILVKKASLWPVIMGSVAGTIMLGVLGTVVGCIQGFGALAHAAPEQRAALMAQAASIALNTTAFAMLLGGFNALIGSIGATIRETIRK
ncbi:MAG: MotA/TolQ/ExbB proton channel family protein [Pseudomonadota bacterium]